MTAAKSRLKERLKDVPEKLQGNIELNHREHRIVRITPTETTENDVPDYQTGEERVAKLEFDLSELRKSSEIRDIAVWLYESDIGYRPSTDDSITGVESVYLPYPEDDGGEQRNEIIDAYTDDIAKFMNEVLAYAGIPDGPLTAYTIPNDAFDAAFSDFFDWRFDEEITSEIVVPLLNFGGKFDKIELSTEVEFFTRKAHKPENIADHLLSVEELIEHLEISRLTEAELGAIFGNKPKIHWFPIPSHKIRFRYKGPGVHPGAVEDIAKSIVTAIRLYYPDGNIGIDDGYKLERGWKYYRTGIYDNTVTFSCRALPEPLTYSAYSRDPKSGPIRGITEKILFSEAEGNELKEFWDNYCLIISSANRGGKFEVPLHRFNLIYERNRYDDQIIDGVITAESTLGREVSSNERVIFAVRGAYLLRDTHNPSYVYNLLDSVYDARIDVVHRGDDVGTKKIEFVEEGQVHEDVIEGRKMIKSLCEILSGVLQKYMSRYNDGQNITETNRDEINEEITRFLANNPSVLAHLLDETLSIGELIDE